MITADTITDEQIRELHDEARQQGDLVLKSTCSFAVHPEARFPHGHEDRYAREKHEARARCAEILNARSAK